MVCSIGVWMDGLPSNFARGMAIIYYGVFARNCMYGRCMVVLLIMIITLKPTNDMATFNVTY